tara:strand:+ start:2646 stop:4184 length:1539 start_codon:yes stop_codon:yes gene_type:complete
MEQAKADEIMEEALEMAKDLFAKGKYDECKPVLIQYLKCSPKNVDEALMHLALSYHKCGQNKKALSMFNEMLEREECHNGDVYNNIAVVHSSVGRFDEAIENLEKAVKENPDRGIFWGNIGLQYRHKEDYDTAIKYFLKAVDLVPDFAKGQAINNLAACYSENFHLKEGEKWYRHNIEINNEFSVSHVDLCYNLQLQDRWEEALYHHNWRFNHFKQLQRFKELDNSEKRWDGEKDLEGKTYLLYCEQGVGDVLMYARYIPILKSKGCKIIFYCYDRLTRLMSRIEGVDEIIELGNIKEVIEMTTINEDDLPDHDFNSSILSLPYLLKKYEPYYDKYLDFTECVDLSAYDQFKIGVVWAGSPLHPDDSKRSCYLREFAPIAALPGVKLFNLQKDARPRKYAYQEEVVDFTDGVDFKLVDCSEYFNDFEDLAQFINSIDLLISVDTAPIHLAGMLEKPTFMLTAYNGDPRWGRRMCRVKDWYPTITAYQQKERGNWKEVFERVTEDVKSLLSNK